MMALLYVVFFTAYFGIAYRLATSVGALLRRKGVSTRMASLASVLVVVFAVVAIFGDAIPIWYTHHRLCESEGGLKVNLTPEEWANANSEAFDEIRKSAWSEPRSFPVEVDGGFKISRFEWTKGFVVQREESISRNYGYRNSIEVTRVIYTPTKQELFVLTDFNGGAGDNSPAIGANSLNDYKIWTKTGSCERAHPNMIGKFRYFGRSFNELYGVISGWSEK
ncbi:hypothetical protein [Niveibacterium sp.]|uniref:hypothetical protein n=1 Tax=Niveibacterium sp. TaxID=2017444 RepID=UPI0035B2A684